MQYTVDSVIGFRLHKREYRVKWATGEITWTGEHHLAACSDLLRAFHTRRGTLAIMSPDLSRYDAPNKNRLNALFASEVRYLPHISNIIKILVLDGPSLCTTRHLLDQRPSASHYWISIPNHSLADMTKISKQLHQLNDDRKVTITVTHETAGECLAQTTESYDAIWLDYEVTWKNNPKTDVAYLFTHGCLRAHGLFCISVASRGWKYPGCASSCLTDLERNIRFYSPHMSIIDRSTHHGIVSLMVRI